MKQSVMRVYSTSQVSKMEAKGLAFMPNSFHLILEKECNKMMANLKLDELPHNLRQKVIDKIFASYKVVVATCGSVSDSGNIAKRAWPRVLIDEATMVTEEDSLMATKSAKQLVLIGDQKQLGPTFDSRHVGPSSLFTRLIELGH